MIHLHKAQYPTLKAFTNIVRLDIMSRHLQKNISLSTKMIGQEHGFCNDEINEIMMNCYEELVKMNCK